VNKKKALHVSVLLNIGVVLLAFVSSVVFWFVTAPTTRFALAVLSMTPIAMGFLLMYLINEIHIIKRDWIFIFIYLIILFASNAIYFLQPVDIAIERFNSFEIDTTVVFEDVEKVEVENVVTPNNVQFFKPVVKDQCWNSKLPCTPYRHDYIYNCNVLWYSGYCVNE
jgi:hypothetical protein